MIGMATVFLWLASGVSAQTRSGGARAPVPVPDSSGFFVLMPFRGGFVNVPLSPSGTPLLTDSEGLSAPLAPPGAPAPLAPPPPGAPVRRGFDDGYQVIAPRAGNPQPPPSSGSGYFVVPGPDASGGSGR
jgi:hypothetical protein